MTTKERIAIIGAGIGGLSAAIRLQHAGYQVEIFEKESLPGGKMNQMAVDGYTFDVGPTIVMWPEAYRELFTLTGRDPEDYIPMQKLTPMYDVYFKGDPYRHYSVSNDLTDLMALMESKDPQTALGFLQYLAEMYQRYQVAMDHFIRRPFRHKSDIYNPSMLINALKLKTFDSAEHMMAKFIPNKDIQQLMAFQTLYIGVSPKNGPSLYNMIPMIELLYGIHYVKGGMHTVAKGFADLFEELGGVIHYNTPVDKILIDEQQVNGLQVGEHFIPSKRVISNADFPYTMKHLIDGDVNRGKYTAKKIDQMDYSCSCLIFYWGVDGTFKDLKTHNFIISEDLDDNMARIFDGRLIDNPSIYLHVPSQVDETRAPEGKANFYLLMPVSELGTAQYAYDQSTVQFYKEKALETLARIPGLENLESQIEVERVFTPNDFESHYNAYRGATFGLQPTLMQSNHFRPQAKAENVSGLYFTGSSTHPGAGVPIVIESGKICADELILDDEG